MRPRSSYLCEHRLFHLSKRDLTFTLPPAPDVSGVDIGLDERAVYTERVEEALADEIMRIGSGQPFPSARQIAEHYGLRKDRVERMRLRLLKRGLLELITGISDEGYYTRAAPHPRSPSKPQ